MMQVKEKKILISNFHHVLNVACFLLGSSWSLNFICRYLEHSVCSIFIGG